MMMIKTLAVAALCFAVAVSASSDLKLEMDDPSMRFKELVSPQTAEAPRLHSNVKLEKPLVLQEKAPAAANDVVANIEKVLGAEPEAAHDPPARDPDNPLANEGINMAAVAADKIEVPRFMERLGEEAAEESGEESGKHDNLPNIPGLKLERATVMNPIDSPHAKKGLAKLADILAGEPEVARVALPGEEEGAAEPADNEKETEGLTVGFIEKEVKLVKPTIMDPTATEHVQSAMAKIADMLDKEPAAARVPIAGEPHRTDVTEDAEAEEKLMYPIGQNQKV